MDGERRDGDGSYVASIEDAFSILGDETRLEILLALAEVIRKQGFDTGLSFSELRSRTGIEDSGRFNYHLDKLTDGFVQQADDEYVIQFPGLAVVSAAYSGLYSDPDGEKPQYTQVEETCSLCESTLEIHYEGNSLWMECPEHGIYDKYRSVPPGAYSGRSLEELAEVVYTRVLTNLMLARRGICLQCWGTMTIDYPIDRPELDNPLDDEFVWTEISCTRCWNQFPPPVRTVVGTHPLVQAAFRERGVGMQEGVRQLTEVGDNDLCETVLVETDPTRLEMCLTFDDETLELTVDENCAVVDFEWS